MDDSYYTHSSTKDSQPQPPTMSLQAAYAVPAMSTTTTTSSSSYPLVNVHAQWQSVGHHAPPSDYPYAVVQPQSASTYSSYHSPTATNDHALYGQRQPSPIHHELRNATSPLSYYVTHATPAALSNTQVMPAIYAQARPSSIVHEGSTRARSTSYSGPYSGPYSLALPVAPAPANVAPDFIAQSTYSTNPSVRMPVPGSEQQQQPSMATNDPTAISTKLQQNGTTSYYTFANSAVAAAAAANGPSYYENVVNPSNAAPDSTQITNSTGATSTATGIPVANGYTSNPNYGYATTPQPQQPQQQQQQSPSSTTLASQPLNQALPPPIVPLANSLSTTNNATIPRSMSMGSIPVPGHHTSSFSSSFTNGSSTPFSGRTTPSGVLTPGSGFATVGNGPNPNGFARSATTSRLGVPSLTIPSSLSTLYAAAAAAVGVDPAEENYLYNSAGVSPTTPVVLSSLLRGGGSGPGTASNGGSVPLTPTTDDTVSWDCYTQLAAGLSRVTTNEADIDEDDEDNDDDTPMLSIPSRMRNSAGGLGSAGSSPRRAIAGGVNRTEKKRRSVTLAAGPSAVASGITRSRSGTMVGGLAALTPITTSANGNPALSLSPVDHHGPSLSSNGVLVEAVNRRESLGNGLPVSNAGIVPGTIGGAAGAAGMASASASGAAAGANSPLAMKELSPSIKPMIEDYLLRYLNHLCMNPNAKDRMGHQIHQMYTARRIQRYEQLYGWRPLKFRIEAFVNGFVDLLTASGIAQDITMKIPHYLNNSKLFSRFNESGNRMKSQGQTIWRVRARCRTDIPGVDGPATAAAATQAVSHPPSAFPQQQQQQQQQQQHPHQAQDDSALMLCPDPLLWEFLPYERCIVGQPPLAIVGTAWQWNLKVHDHWTPRKKVTWSLTSGGGSSNSRSSTADGDSSSPSASSTTSNSLPKWLSLHGSKLKGTPTQPGEYPISVEATFQEDNDPEPVIVRGHFKIQVSKAIGGWKNKAAVTNDGLADSPTDTMEEMQGGNLDLSGGANGPVFGGVGGAGDSMSNGNAGLGMSEVPLLFGQRMNFGMYGQSIPGELSRPQLHQSSSSSSSYSHPYAYVH